MCMKEWKKNKKENEEKAAFVTFMVSAFWHGFYPGYYIFFTWVHLLLAISKKVYKFREYFSWMPDIMKWVLSNLIFWFFIAQWGPLHINLQLDYAWNVLKNTYFIGVAPLIILYILCWIIPNPKSSHHKVNIGYLKFILMLIIIYLVSFWLIYQALL